MTNGPSPISASVSRRENRKCPSLWQGHRSKLQQRISSQKRKHKELQSSSAFRCKSKGKISLPVYIDHLHMLITQSYTFTVILYTQRRRPSNTLLILTPVFHSPFSISIFFELLRRWEIVLSCFLSSVFQTAALTFHCSKLTLTSR